VGTDPVVPRITIALRIMPAMIERSVE